MDEFLEKLAEDQRRMRKFLRTQASRFKKIGASFAVARERGARIFIVGEPPLDHVAEIVAVEYLQQLPAVALPLDDRNAPAPLPDQAGELDPAASSGAGPPLIARHLSRHFRSGDVLVVIAHLGQHPAIKALLGFSKLKGTHAILVGGLDARAALRKAADTAISLPTRGVKTVCEASFVVARILARVARAHVRETAGRDEEEGDKLIRLECPSCKEPVFVEERYRGKKGQCPLCRASLKIPDEGRNVLVASASHVDVPVAEATSDVGRAGSSRRKPKKPLKQSVLNVKAAAEAALGEEDTKARKGSSRRRSDDERDDEREAVRESSEVEADSNLLKKSSTRTTHGRPASTRTPRGVEADAAAIVGAAGETTSGPEDEPPPVGLSSFDDDEPAETVVAPEDVAFDEYANATESADPFALPDAFVADLVMPQGRPVVTGAPPPSDVNPIVSGEPPGSSDEASPVAGKSARLVSARFTVQDCKLRFGRGGYPLDDSGPEHPLEGLSTRHCVFVLDPEDEMASTLDKGDELWLRLEIPAFIEPVMARGVVQKIGGNSDGTRGGTRVELEWKDIDAALGRKLARAAETLGVGK